MVISWLKSGPMTFDRSINACGAVWNVLFLSMLKVTINMFYCEDNPTGELTMMSQASVICYDKEWLNALPLSIIGFFLYFVVIYGAVAYLTFNGKILIKQNAAWKLRLQFIFARFSSDSYYWWVYNLTSILLCVVVGLVTQLRNTLMLLPTIVLSGKKEFQIVYCFTLVLVYTTASCSIMPWRHYSSTLVEALFMMSLLLILTIMSIKTIVVDKFSSAHEENLQSLLVAVVVIPLVFSITTASYFVSKKFDFKGRFSKRRRMHIMSTAELLETYTFQSRVTIRRENSHKSLACPRQTTWYAKYCL
eukprot:GHVR01101771.1.p1 GENE.GHVR01101771.1~~GHVR01101771.1.p1  ORF type:complete len:305 (+),score=2.40 GHVR01101771.1:3-917(+)